MSEFVADRRRPDGRGARCLPCRRALARQRYHETTGSQVGADRPVDLTVLSLGAGVQSSTVLLMSLLGELPPLDCAVFADTGWEPPAVYEWLNWLTDQADAHGVPIHRVDGGNLLLDMLERDFLPMPLYQRDDTGRVRQLRRTCTTNYKIRPIRAFYKRQLGQVQNRHVEQWLGISWDEIGRMRDSDARYIHNRYPLVEQRLTRDDCLAWMADHGYPTPPRSACVGCPYRSAADWAGLRASPTWAEAVRFDEYLAGRGDDLYLHPAGRLDEVELVGPGAQECGGYCGL
jgi:hypothetical protein